MFWFRRNIYTLFYRPFRAVWQKSYFYGNLWWVDPLFITDCLNLISKFPITGHSLPIKNAFEIQSDIYIWVKPFQHNIICYVVKLNTPEKFYKIHSIVLIISILYFVFYALNIHNLKSWFSRDTHRSLC